MKTLKNYLYNLSYQLLTLIVPLITTPYISRVLKAEGIGRYSYTQAIICLLYTSDAADEL
mgnify:CR=1 FL=1